MSLFDEGDRIRYHPVSASDHAKVMGPEVRSNPLFAAGQWIGCWQMRHEDPRLLPACTDPDRMDYWGDFEWCALLLDGWTTSSVLVRADHPQRVAVVLLREVAGASGPHRISGSNTLTELRLLTLSRRASDGAWLGWSLRPWSGSVDVDEPLEVISTEYLG